MELGGIFSAQLDNSCNKHPNLHWNRKWLLAKVV